MSMPEDGLKKYYLPLFGDVLVFSSDRPELLEKCLRWQYGEAVVVKPPEGFSGRESARLYVRRAGRLVRGSADGEAEVLRLSDVNPGAVLCFNRKTGNAEAVFAGADFHEDVRLFFTALVTFAQLVMRRRGYYVFHASAVALRGAGVLIGGANGCGKSTLMRRLLEAGAEYLADDAAVVDMRAKPFLIRRSPEILNGESLSPDAVKGLAGLGFRKTAGGHFLAPPAEPLAAPVAKVIFPAIVKEELSVVSLTNRDAFLKLLELRRTPLERGGAAEFFEACAEMAEGAAVAEFLSPEGRIPSPEEAVRICESL